MSVRNDGFIGIGTINSYGPFNPWAKLQIICGNERDFFAVRADKNVGIELRSESTGGTPYIDFANNDSTDFNMRIIMDNAGRLLVAGGDFFVNGTLGATICCSSSDRRLKTSIFPLDSSLDKIIRLQGVSYEWNRYQHPERSFPEGRQIGMIAQDVEKVLPEIVNTDKEGYKSLSYDKITAVLVEAIKEQQKEIDNLRQEIYKIKKTGD